MKGQNQFCDFLEPPIKGQHQFFDFESHQSRAHIYLILVNPSFQNMRTIPMLVEVSVGWVSPNPPWFQVFNFRIVILKN
jgi:hypothetical protein